MIRINSHLLSNIIYWLTRSKWLILTFLLGLVLLLLPTPEGLTIQGYRIFIIVIIALILIISEPIPLPGVALLIIVLQVYFGIGEANDIARAFMNDAVFFIMGSLMLAVAIVQQGWDARIALGIVKITSNNTSRIAVGFAVISALLASFIGEHTVAAMMLPIGMTLVRYTNKDTKQVRNLAALLLFSIAYGSLIGSIGTPSGGGRNAIMLTYWKEFHIESITYLKWMAYVYPLILLQLPVLVFILWRNFIPEYLLLDSGIRRLKLQVAKAGKISSRQILAAVEFGLVFLGWVLFSDTIGLGIIALTGVLLYLITGLIKWEEMVRHVNWGVIIMFGATISLGWQIMETGAASWLTAKVLEFLGNSLYVFPAITDVVIVVLTTALANVISSSATVAVLGPIFLNLPGDAVHNGLLTAIASAFGYFTVIAAPACTIIYASGMVNAKDFLKVGWKMGLASIIITVLYVNIYWELLN